MATDPNVQRIYYELARQWRDMAARSEVREQRLAAKTGGPRAATVRGSPSAAWGGPKQSRAGAPGRCIPLFIPAVPAGDDKGRPLAAA